METPELTAALARFDSLPPVEARRLRGEWRGSGVPTGHPLDGLLELYGWWGKRFDGPDDVHPLVFQDGRGRFSVDPTGLPLSLLGAGALHDPRLAALGRRALRLRRTRKPRARLRMMTYRGVATATMSYDTLPINDHFRAVDDDTLLGVMDARGLPPFVFTLHRPNDPGNCVSW